MDYIELLKNVDYFSFITAFAKWIFLFLLISILVLIIGTKLKLFERKTKAARILVKAYYVIIPLYFVFFAIKFAPIKNSQVEINKAIDKDKTVVTQFAYNFFNSFVSDSTLQQMSAKDIVNGYLSSYVYTVDSLTQAENLSIGKRFIYKIKRKIEFGFLTGLIESKIVEKASGSIGIDNKTGKALYCTNFNELFREGEIVNIFKMELNSVFMKIYKSMFIIFVIGLLIPAVEIILARILKY